ncbi:MAG: HAD family phosphatase [Planctomycetota bacterium]|nr:MAG: HAD family phosphatase [Planctomycetota bacterium]
MLRAVIFDFDGVITDSEVLHLRAFNQVLGDFGIEIATKDYYKDYLGLTDFDCFEALINEGRLRIKAEEIKNLVEHKNQIFEKLAKSEGRIIEGVRDFLQMLKQNDIPMAICSGALLVEIELILEEAQLRSFFDVIVSAECVEKGKPEPEGFLLALQKMNEKKQGSILADQCIVIEDSHWGLEAANAAGMHTIAITNSYDAEQLAMAEKIITRLSELNIRDLQLLCA